MDYKKQWLFSSATAIALLLSTASFQTLSAATAPTLGTAGSFAVLGGSTVTNTGPTVINGNLGVSPGSAVTGFPPGIVVPPGTIHAADAVAAQAQSDNTTAYNVLAGQACNDNLTGQDLGGLTLTSGVYCFSSSAQLTGTLTLDAQGDPNAVFIFQIGSTLTTASNSSVNIINGGSGCNVFFQVGSSATLGTNTSFIGNILALTSITLTTGTQVSGRALAQNGAVTLDDNTVSITQCNASFTAPPTIAKTFGAAAIGVGGTTSLSFTINNPNATTALTGVAFTDTLPTGLVVSTPNGLTGSCGGGTITATAGSGSISLAGATLAGGASCTFSVNVTGTAPGTPSNSVTVSSTNGGTGNTSTTSVAVVVAPPPVAPPTIAKTFGAAAIGVGGTTSLSFTINNPNATTALTGVAFTDTLPTGLVVSTPNGLTGSCGGGTITATAGSGSISLAGATLAGGASCTFSVNVTGTAPGTPSNSVTVSSTNGGTGNTSTTSVAVVVAPPPVAPPTIAKTFGAAAIGVGGTTSLSFTINNPNATTALTGVAFTDTLPTGLVVSTPNGLTGSCGGGTITATAGSGSISLAGATLAGGASCTFSVNVTATMEGALTNTIGITSANGGLGNTASATITVGAGVFQISYASNLNIADSIVNLTNSGASAGGNQPVVNQNSYGDICVNAYVYGPDQELATCCSCLVSPDSLHAWPVSYGPGNLLQNVTNGAVLNSIQAGNSSVVIKLLATAPTGAGAGLGASCPSPAAPNGLATGLIAWATHAHPTNTATAAITETAFANATLSGGELGKLTGDCSALLTRGSGGVCPACITGGLTTTLK